MLKNIVQLFNIYRILLEELFFQRTTCGNIHQKGQKTYKISFRNTNTDLSYWFRLHPVLLVEVL